jgi:hypothetical protein
MSADGDDVPLMTLRVSHDGGRTFGPVRVFRSGDHLPPLHSSQWPPCQCPRHRDKEARNA